MASATDIAWLAGLFDGEGCVRICKNNVRDEHFTLQVTVEVIMAHEGGVAIAQQIGNSLCERDKGVYQRPAHPNQLGKRPQSHVRWTRKRDVQSILLALVPYLRVKKLEALLALDFLSRSVPAGARYLPGEIDVALMRLISRLKRDDAAAITEAESYLTTVGLLVAADKTDTKAQEPPEPDTVH